MNATRWSLNFDCCQECHTTEVKHWAKGLCKRCYQRQPVYRDLEKQRRKANERSTPESRKRAREKSRRYWQEHPEAYERHKERMRERSRRVRAERGEPLYRRPPKYWRNRRYILNQNPACVVCGSRENLEVHHIIPESQGGTHSVSNLEVRCKSHHVGPNGVHRLS